VKRKIIPVILYDSTFKHIEKNFFNYYCIRAILTYKVIDFTPSSGVKSITNLFSVEIQLYLDNGVKTIRNFNVLNV